jgi:hypothetical protein
MAPEIAFPLATGKLMEMCGEYKDNCMKNNVRLWDKFLL